MDDKNKKLFLYISLILGAAILMKLLKSSETIPGEALEIINLRGE
jgi:hypothetical protein